MKQRDFTAKCGVLEGVGRGKGASQGEVGEGLGRGSPCGLERKQGSGAGFSGGQRARNGHQVQHSDRDKSAGAG